jgi:hypothetical protein
MSAERPDWLIVERRNAHRREARDADARDDQAPSRDDRRMGANMNATIACR